MGEFRSYDRRRLSHRSFKLEIAKGDFRNGQAVQSTFEAMRFEDSPMHLFNFTNSAFLDCEFNRCDLSMASFNASVLKNVQFNDCTLDQAAFKLAMLDHVGIIGGRAEYAVFEDAEARDVLLDTQLHGADLRFAKTIRVDFGKSNLWGVTVKANCAFWADNVFDRRQVEIFIGLLSKSMGNDELREKLRGMLSPETVAIVDRVVLSAREG